MIHDHALPLCKSGGSLWRYRPFERSRGVGLLENSLRRTRYLLAWSQVLDHFLLIDMSDVELFDIFVRFWGGGNFE